MLAALSQPRFLKNSRLRILSGGLSRKKTGLQLRCCIFATVRVNPCYPGMPGLAAHPVESSKGMMERHYQIQRCNDQN